MEHKEINITDKFKILGAKYDDSDIPSPSEKKDALPNSRGEPVP